MAQATPAYSRFHNLSNEALADALGEADAVLKGTEKALAECKEEFKRRGLASAAGERVEPRADLRGRSDGEAIVVRLRPKQLQFGTRDAPRSHSFTDPAVVE
jgi:hypothetical protein